MSDYSNSPQTREQIKEVLKPGQMTFIDTFEHLVEMPNMPKLAEVFTDFKKVLNWISELNDDPDNQRFLAIVKSLEDSPDIRLQAIAKMLLELPIEDLPEMSQRYLYLVHNADTPKHAGDVPNYQDHTYIEIMQLEAKSGDEPARLRLALWEYHQSKPDIVQRAKYDALIAHLELLPHEYNPGTKRFSRVTKDQIKHALSALGIPRL